MRDPSGEQLSERKQFPVWDLCWLAGLNHRENRIQPTPFAGKSKPAHGAGRGFTLAELLIALGILGAITVFTIPKILNAQQDSRRLAVFKETLSAIQNIIYIGRLSGELVQGNNFNYISSKVNAIKICSTNVQTQGCWTHPHLSSDSANKPGFILSNGATLNGFSGSKTTGNGVASFFFVDWNGASGPNLAGDDQIVVCYSYGTATFINGSDNWGIIRPGEMIGCANHPSSAALYQEIFQ